MSVFYRRPTRFHYLTIEDRRLCFTECNHRPRLCSTNHVLTGPPATSLVKNKLEAKETATPCPPGFENGIFLSSLIGGSSRHRTLEALLSFLMACIIPRRPWQPVESPRPGPMAGELSCDAASKQGRMLTLSVGDALSSMPGSTPFRQLSVLRRLCGGVACTSVGGVSGLFVIQSSNGFLAFINCSHCDK